MKFRIHYETAGAYWCIQFSRWGFKWKTATEYRGCDEWNILRFKSFDEADAYVVSSGIESAYAQWVEPSIRAHLIPPAPKTEDTPTHDNPQRGKAHPEAPQGLSSVMVAADLIDLLTAPRATV